MNQASLIIGAFSSKTFTRKTRFGRVSWKYDDRIGWQALKTLATSCLGSPSETLAFGFEFALMIRTERLFSSNHQSISHFWVLVKASIYTFYYFRSTEPSCVSLAVLFCFGLFCCKMTGFDARPIYVGYCILNKK